MARQKTKDGESICAYIENKKLLEHDAQLIGMSVSSFIDYLALNYHQGQNPFEKLKKIDEKELELKKEREKIMKEIEGKQSFDKLLKEKKEQALSIIKRLFIDGRDIFEIQGIAKNWAIRLNIPAEQLITEVMLGLKLNKQEIR